MSVLSEALSEVGGTYAELLWPTRCIGCDLPGMVLCDECREALPWIVQRWACPVCGAPFGWLTCTECGRSRGAGNECGSHSDDKGDAHGWPMRSVVCSFGYRGTPASMVTGLKDAHELRLVPIMAAAIATSLDEAVAWDAADGAPRFDPSRTDAICFVPATRAAYARRGFDHMELVSRSLSQQLGIALADVLVRTRARDQRSLGRAERAMNLRGTVEVAGDVSGLHLLLADDVVTTGASLATCTEALLEAGASSVTACAFARVMGR